MSSKNMTKKIILISVSIIFFSAAALGIGWIVKKEVDKGKTAHEQSANVSKNLNNKEAAEENKNPKIEEEVTVSNKNEATKALEDMDSIVNSTENDLLK